VIAGTLEVQILANVARLQQDMDKVTGSVGKAMAGVDKAAGIASKALGLVGVSLSVASFAGMIKGSIDAADSLNDLSKSTGLSVETLSGLKLAAAQSGTQLDTTAKAINYLSKNIGENAKKYKELGITARDPLEAFKQLADQFASMEDVQKRNALANEALGRSWEQVAPLLAEGGDAIQEMIDKGIELGGVTTDMAKQADAYNDSLAELSLGAQGLVNKFAGAVVPALADFASVANQMAQDGSLSEMLDDVAVAAEAVALVMTARMVPGMMDTAKAMTANVSAVLGTASAHAKAAASAEAYAMVDVQLAASAQAASVAEYQKAAASNAVALADFNAAKAAAARTPGFYLNTQAMVALTSAEVAATNAATALATAESAAALATGRLATAQSAATTAGAAHAAALARTGVAAGALNGALMLVGGPAGAFTLAAGAAALYVFQLDSLAESHDKVLASIEAERRGLASLTKDELQASIEKTKEAIALHERMMSLWNSGIGFAANGQIADTREEIDKLNRLLRDQTYALSDLKTGFTITSTSAEEYRQAGGDVAEKTQEIIDKLNQQRAMLGLTEREQFIYKAGLDAIATKAAPEVVEQVKEIAAALYDEKKALEDAADASKRAWDQMVDDVVAAGDVIAEELAAQRKAADQVWDNMVDEIVITTDQMLEEVKRQEEAQKDAAEKSEKYWQDFGDSMGDVFADWVVDGKNASDLIEDYFKAAAARMVSNWISSGIMDIFSGGLGSGEGEGSGGTGWLSTLASLFKGGASGSGGPAAAGTVSGAWNSTTGLWQAPSMTAPAAGGAGTGFMGALKAVPVWGWIAAAAMNEFSARKNGVRDENDWDYAQDLAGGKVLEQDVMKGWIAQLFGSDKLGLHGDMKVGADLMTLDFSNAFRNLSQSSLAKMLGVNGGTQTSNSGFLLHDVAGASADRKFGVDPFESGFAPVGFNRRGDQANATEVIDYFRGVDSLLTKLFSDGGFDVNMSDSNFRHLGTSETGQGDGVFIGAAMEGGDVIEQIEQQLSGYVDAFIQSIPGLGADVIEKILSGTDAADTIRIAQEEIAKQIAAQKELAEATAVATDSVEQLIESTFKWGQAQGLTAEDKTYSQYASNDTPAEAMAKELRNRGVYQNQERHNRIHANSESDLQAWIASIRGIPKFADGGIHDGGLAIVGERGPELLDMPRGRVHNAQETKAMLAGNNSGMQALLAKVDTMQIALNALIVNTGSTARNIDAVTKAGGGRKFATVEVTA
jgi:hypothetical protein